VEPALLRISKCADRFTVGGRQPPRERRRGGDAHLLAENSPDRELEAVPRARYAKTGLRGDTGGKAAITPEMFLNGTNVCIHVEQSAEAAHDRRGRGGA